MLVGLIIMLVGLIIMLVGLIIIISQMQSPKALTTGVAHSAAVMQALLKG